MIVEAICIGGPLDGKEFAFDSYREPFIVEVPILHSIREIYDQTMPPIEIRRCEYWLEAWRSGDTTWILAVAGRTASVPPPSPASSIPAGPS